MTRRYMNWTIDRLEAEFDGAHAVDDRDALNLVFKELAFRDSPRARALRQRVVQAIGVTEKTAKPPPKPSEPPESQVLELDLAIPRAVEPTVPDIPDKVAIRPPHVENPRRAPSRRKPTKAAPSLPALAAEQASAVVSAWTALEVLSPSLVFRRPTDLIEGNIRRVIEFEPRSELPWIRDRAGQGNNRRFYHIVLGAIRMDVATERLLAIYGDMNIENALMPGYAPVAILTIDKDGQPVAPDAIVVSSFAWGLPLALQRKLSALDGWTAAERKLIEVADSIVRRSDEDGRPLPVDRGLIERLYRHIVQELSIDDQYLAPPSLALQVDQHPLATEPPEPPPMGSFFLGDLARAKERLASSTLPELLASYLGMKPLA